MARITVEDCMRRIPNRFEMILTATARARQLHRGATPLVDPDGDKFTVIALREIASGRIGVEVLKRSDLSGPASAPSSDAAPSMSPAGHVSWARPHKSRWD